MNEFLSLKMEENTCLEQHLRKMHEIHHRLVLVWDYLITDEFAMDGVLRSLPPASRIDEDIPCSFTVSPIKDVAVQDKPHEVRIGPMTRSRTKLLEHQVNSLLIEFDVCDYENFI